MFKPIIKRDTNFDASHGIDSVGALARQSAERAGRNGKQHPAAGLRKINLPVFDNGGDVSTAASRRLQESGDAGLQSLLNSADEQSYSKPAASATAGKAQPTLTGAISDYRSKKASDAIGNVTTDRGDDVMQPSYMPGGAPAVAAPSMPVITTDTTKAPVFDKGGNVNVNDGKHQLAIVEEGERVLTPEQNQGLKKFAKEHNVKGFPKIYDEGGEITAEDMKAASLEDTDEKRKLQPIVLPAPTADKAVQPPHPAVEPSVSEPAEQLIQERGTPEEKPAPTLGQGVAKQWLKHIGVPVEPSISEVSEPIAERPTAGLPKIAAPQEMHQDVAGGALIPGASSTETPIEQRDLRNMNRKAQADRLEQQRQEALKAGDLETADKLAVAKAELQKTPWSDHSLLGKIGHVASVVGNVAGDIVSPNIMAQIPGTALNRQLKERAAFNRIAPESEADAREAQVSAKESPKPKLLPGEGNTAATPDGTRYQRYEMPDGSTAWAQEGTVPRAAIPQTTTGGLPRISVPTAGGLPTGAVVGKPAGEPKAETREQHLNRYAELKNLKESGAQLNDQDQKELNTLTTELTVPKATLNSYNKQIDSALYAAGVPETLWSNYHAQPGATAEEAKQAIADAKSFSGETYQQGAEGRTMDKEERAQQRKDKATVVYAEDENGQLIRTSKFDADKRGLVAEEMKAGDISKDRSAIRQLNDVQTNVNRYEKAIAEDMPKVSDEDRKHMTEILAIEHETGGGLLQADAGGKYVSISGAFPQWSAKLSSRKYDLAKEDLEALSPEAKSVMNAYLRTAASVPTYLKALAGIGRSNKETLNLELANVPMPYYDLSTVKGRMQAFQDNVDQAKSGFPNNLPGMKLVESERAKGEKSAHPSAEAGIPKGATGIAPGSDGNNYYHDAKGNILGKVK